MEQPPYRDNDGPGPVAFRGKNEDLELASMDLRFIGTSGLFFISTS